MEQPLTIQGPTDLGEEHISQKAISIWHPQSTKYHETVHEFNTSLSEYVRSYGHIIALLAVLLVLFYILLFIHLHRRYSTFARRADRAWARESRRNAAAIRQAHRRQALRGWIQRIFPARAAEVQLEKRQDLVDAQEVVLEDAVQAEIRELSAAADFVAAVTSAGPSSACTRSPVAPPPLVIPYFHAEPPRPPPGRPESLPEYRSEAGYSDGPPPPEYDDDRDSDSEMNGVADGFQYHYRHHLHRHHQRTRSIDSPDSSVITTSTRWSAELDFVPPKEVQRV
jgi:hypothetical protein